MSEPDKPSDGGREVGHQDMSEIVLEPTSRGFLKGTWTDDYGKRCSIQESSADPLNRIWLGIERERRMHLNQEMVAALLPILTRFVETGGLS
jgi:hypothetical protein